MACNLFNRLFRRRREQLDVFRTPSLPDPLASLQPTESNMQQAETALAQTQTSDELENIYLFNCLPQQASYTLFINDVPLDFNLAAVANTFHLIPGYLGTALEVTDSTWDVTIHFQTATEATMAQARHPSVDINEQRFEIQQSRKRIKTDAPKIEEPTAICKICYTKIDGPQSVPCLLCKSPWCYDCIAGHFKAALNDQELFPAKCCANIIHPDVINGIMPAADFEKYKLRYEEHTTPAPLYCANVLCSAFMPPRTYKKNAKVVDCLSCSTKTCISCRDVVNSDMHSCSTTETTEIMKKFSYKRCPRCNAGIAKMFGCPHVRCQCGAHWCWDCQRPIQMCWQSPCERSREDGNTSETGSLIGDGDDAGSEAEENQAQSDDVQPVETVVVVETEVAANPEIPPVPEILPEPATMEATVTEPKTEEPAAEDSPSDLDASDFNDWENEDYDFGHEPIDESWDTWGCMHNLQPLTTAKIPQYWMSAGTTHVHCLKCYESVRIVGEDPEPLPAEPEKKKPKESNILEDWARASAWLNRTNETASDDQHPGTPPLLSRSASTSSTATVTAENHVAAPRDPKPASKPDKEHALIYNCMRCGIVQCRRCKRQTTKEIAAGLKRKSA